MSSSDRTDGKVRLEIKAATDLTEVNVLDARLRSVDLPANTGTVEVDLPPGVYEVSFRNGSSWEHRLTLLDGKLPRVTVQQGTRGTLRGGGARDKADNNDDAPGSVPHPGAAEVLLFVHDPRETENTGKHATSAKSGDRFTGLSLVTETGARVPAGPSRSQDSSAPCSFFPSPGYFRVRLDTGLKDQVFEMPLVVCPGWQTCVYLPLVPYGGNRWRPDLSQALVRMVNPAGPHDETSESRSLEVAALDSIAGKKADLHGPSFNRLLQNLLEQKCFNPILGLCAAHLIAGRDDKEKALLKEIIENLARMTERGPEGNLPPAGFEHPDVTALRFQLDRLEGREVQIREVPFPPTLVASWNIVRSVAAQMESIIPRGSLSDRVAARITTASLWLIWQGTPAEPPPAQVSQIQVERSLPPNVSTLARRGVQAQAVETSRSIGSQSDALSDDDALAVIGAAFRNAAIREWYRAALSDDDSGARKSNEIEREEQLIAQAIHPIAATERAQEIFDHVGLYVSAAPSKPSTPSLAASVRLPAGTVMRAAQSLSTKLLEQAQRIGIDLQTRANNG
jgi:hypothetical protein